MESSGYRTISGLVFGVIAILQVIRAAMQVPVHVGSTSIPVMASWVAAVAAGGLCIWAFRSAAR